MTTKMKLLLALVSLIGPSVLAQTPSPTAISCPFQAKPEVPREVWLKGVQGEVAARALIKDGVVTEVAIVSGPEEFHVAVKTAMMGFRCKGNGVVSQRFNFINPNVIASVEMKPRSTSTKSDGNEIGYDNDTGPQANKYIDLSELDTKSNDRKAILIFSRIGDRNSGKKIRIDVDDLNFELGIDDVKQVAVSSGRYSVSVDSSLLFRSSSNSATFNFGMAKNAIYDIRVAFPYAQQPSLPEVWFRRIGFDGRLANSTQSNERDFDNVLATNHALSKKRFQQILNDTRTLIDTHRSQAQYQTLSGEITKDLSRNDMSIKLIRAKNSVCKVLFYKSVLKEKDYLDFYDAISEIHKYDCRDVLFDLTGQGGDGESGVRIGLYINLNGWSTITGGTSVPFADSVCNSACTLGYFGGVKRYRGSVPTYLHQPKKKTGTCESDESIWGNFIYQYLTYVVGENGRKIYRELMMIPCDMVLQPSEKTLHFWLS